MVTSIRELFRSFNGRVVTVVFSALFAAGGFIVGEMKTQQQQDFEIHEIQMRLNALETVTQVNNEARIRSEEKLSESASRLQRIENLLEQHEEETKRRR